MRAAGQTTPFQLGEMGGGRRGGRVSNGEVNFNNSTSYIYMYMYYTCKSAFVIDSKYILL